MHERQSTEWQIDAPGHRSILQPELHLHASTSLKLQQIHFIFPSEWLSTFSIVCLALGHILFIAPLYWSIEFTSFSFNFRRSLSTSTNTARNCELLLDIVYLHNVVLLLVSNCVVLFPLCRLCRSLPLIWCVAVVFFLIRFVCVCECVHLAQLELNVRVRISFVCVYVWIAIRSGSVGVGFCSCGCSCCCCWCCCEKWST